MLSSWNMAPGSLCTLAANGLVEEVCRQAVVKVCGLGPVAVWYSCSSSVYCVTDQTPSQPRHFPKTRHACTQTEIRVHFCCDREMDIHAVYEQLLWGSLYYVQVSIPAFLAVLFLVLEFCQIRERTSFVTPFCHHILLYAFSHLYPTWHTTTFQWKQISTPDSMNAVISHLQQRECVPNPKCTYMRIV